MRKIKFSIVILLVMLTFCGCVKPVDLTDEETDMFAEYISKEVLKRDKYYDQQLLELNYSTEEEDEEETTGSTVALPKDKVPGQSTSNTQDKKPEKTYTLATVDEILGNDSVNVAYRTSNIFNSYPEDGGNYFVISSSKGFKLLVLDFDIKNTTGKDVTYSMLKQDVMYKLVMDNGNEYSPLLTLLVDDLQFVNKTIPANETEKGVLVFRINQEEVKSKGVLQITSGNKCVTQDIK